MVSDSRSLGIGSEGQGHEGPEEQIDKRKMAPQDTAIGWREFLESGVLGCTCQKEWLKCECAFNFNF